MNKFFNLLVVIVSIVLINFTLNTMVDCYISMQESKAKINIVNPRDYQVEITNTITYIYDGERLVGTMVFDKNTAFDRIMLEDNQ